MQQNLISEEEKKYLENITYVVGSPEIVCNIENVRVKKPFDSSVIEFLNALSKKILSIKEAKLYSDVVTFGFWIRKSSIEKLRNRFVDVEKFHVGRGVAFHIAPSNVPVNYAYSLVTGLLTGNANIVRIPTKDFPQVTIINKAIEEVLESYQELKNYICLVRYGREQRINDIFSLNSDVRIIWGGDETIAEIRKSPLKPRAFDITFADRYSLAIIDSDTYLAINDKNKIADEFYNDTYLTDQNACTSPRIVVWIGDEIDKAKKIFWESIHHIVEKKYVYQSIQGINKLTSVYLLAANIKGTKLLKDSDNLIVRVKLSEINPEIMQYKDNSGYFFEYHCRDIKELRDVCNDTHCQTVSYLGDNSLIINLLESGIKGVDRIVPLGKTMDYDFIWDGYNLYERLTRVVSIV